MYGAPVELGELAGEEEEDDDDAAPVGVSGS